jgi:hypothetical protein
LIKKWYVASLNSRDAASLNAAAYLDVASLDAASLGAATPLLFVLYGIPYLCSQETATLVFPESRRKSFP